MTILLVVVHVLVCFILILVILLQAGRGSGLSWGVFGGTPQSFFGTKSASFLTKATTVSAILFLLTCIALNILETKKSRSLLTSAKPGQIDVEKIKKVLEKVKSETPETPTTTPTSESQTANPNLKENPKTDVTKPAPSEQKEASAAK